LVLAIIITLIGGITILYHTKAFWGLEDNANASALNSSFNSIPNLTSLVLVVVVLIAVVFILTTARGFG